jgi:hypothetical protein
MGRGKLGNVEPTHGWQLLLPLFGWPEQERYEEIRPLVLFDVPVAERAQEVGTSAIFQPGYVPLCVPDIMARFPPMSVASSQAIHRGDG